MVPQLRGSYTTGWDSTSPAFFLASGLPNLDKITVGIADIAPDLVLVLLRRCQELSTPVAPFGVDRLNVCDPDIEEAADPVEIAWRLEGNSRLVVGRAFTGIDEGLLGTTTGLSFSESAISLMTPFNTVNRSARTTASAPSSASLLSAATFVRDL